MKYDSRKLLLAVDIAGTFLFGIEGADAAIRGNLDLLGLMVLAFATALAGGVVRDLLIGAVPPGAIRDWRYAATALSAALITFFFYHFVEGRRRGTPPRWDLSAAGVPRRRSGSELSGSPEWDYESRGCRPP